MSNNGKFPIPVPFGMGGGDKELITVTKNKGRSFLNTFGKGRFSPQDATDIVIILAIATDEDGKIDPGTVDMVESLFAGSYAENGLGRAEHLMMKTGIIAPGSLPGFDQSPRNGRKEPTRLFPRRKKESSDDNNE